MDATVIVALIAAIAAIVAPVITAVVNSRTELKIKKLDMLQNNIHAAVAELTKSFSGLYDCQGALTACWAFMAAAYKTMSLVQDTAIQEQLSALIAAIRTSHGTVTNETATSFECIINALSTHLEIGSK